MERPARETPRGAELRAAVLSDPKQCRSRGLARSDSECRGGGKRTDADKRESAESGVAAGSLFKQEDACMRAEMIADGSAPTTRRQPATASAGGELTPDEPGRHSRGWTVGVQVSPAAGAQGSRVARAARIR
jgi:hypothetical protein